MVKINESTYPKGYSIYHDYDYSYVMHNKKIVGHVEKEGKGHRAYYHGSITTKTKPFPQYRGNPASTRHAGARFIIARHIKAKQPVFEQTLDELYKNKVTLIQKQDIHASQAKMFDKWASDDRKHSRDIKHKDPEKSKDLKRNAAWSDHKAERHRKAAGLAHKMVIKKIVKENQMNEGGMKDWLMDMQSHADDCLYKHKGDKKKAKEEFLKKHPNQHEVFDNHVKDIRQNEEQQIDEISTKLAGRYITKAGKSLEKITDKYLKSTDINKANLLAKKGEKRAHGIKQAMKTFNEAKEPSQTGLASLFRIFKRNPGKRAEGLVKRSWGPTWDAYHTKSAEWHEKKSRKFFDKAATASKPKGQWASKMRTLGDKHNELAKANRTQAGHMETRKEFLRDILRRQRTFDQYSNMVGRQIAAEKKRRGIKEDHSRDYELSQRAIRGRKKTKAEIEDMKKEFINRKQERYRSRAQAMIDRHDMPIKGRYEEIQPLTAGDRLKRKTTNFLRNRDDDIAFRIKQGHSDDQIAKDTKHHPTVIKAVRGSMSEQQIVESPWAKRPDKKTANLVQQYLKGGGKVRKFPLKGSREEKDGYWGKVWNHDGTKKITVWVPKKHVVESVQYKVGDIVDPIIGPHKNHPHKIIHIHDDGGLNIKPLNIHPRQIRYRLGAVTASSHQVVPNHNYKRRAWEQIEEAHTLAQLKAKVGEHNKASNAAAIDAVRKLFTHGYFSPEQRKADRKAQLHLKASNIAHRLKSNKEADQRDARIKAYYDRIRKEGLNETPETRPKKLLGAPPPGSFADDQAKGKYRELRKAQKKREEEKAKQTWKQVKEALTTPNQLQNKVLKDPDKYVDDAVRINRIMGKNTKVKQKIRNKGKNVSEIPHTEIQ